MTISYLFRGQKVDSDEWVTGWLVHFDLIRPANTGLILKTKNMSAEGDFTCDVIRVKQDTIKPAAVMA